MTTVSGTTTNSQIQSIHNWKMHNVYFVTKFFLLLISQYTGCCNINLKPYRESLKMVISYHLMFWEIFIKTAKLNWVLNIPIWNQDLNISTRFLVSNKSKLPTPLKQYYIEIIVAGMLLICKCIVSKLVKGELGSYIQTFWIVNIHYSWKSLEQKWVYKILIVFFTSLVSEEFYKSQMTYFRINTGKKWKLYSLWVLKLKIFLPELYLSKTKIIMSQKTHNLY